MMKEVIEGIVLGMMDKLDEEQLRELKNVLFMKLCDFEIRKKETSLVPAGDSDYELIRKFELSKEASGKARRSVENYTNTVKVLLNITGKRIADITDDDIWMYLGYCRSVRKNSYTTIRNNRAYLSSFFSWLRKNRYIAENPMDLVDAIKADETVKKPFSDEEVVKVRDACKNKRDLAIVDFLHSSMVRVSELAGLNIEDIYFSDRECIVFGKGRKERVAYFDGIAKVHLQQYLESRTDSNPALFVSLDKKHERLQKSGIENLLRSIGKRTGIKKVHPHRFRRTGATRCLEHGMPLDHVQQLLGHKDIRTTQIYARSNRKAVKFQYNTVFS